MVFIVGRSGFSAIKKLLSQQISLQGQEQTFTPAVPPGLVQKKYPLNDIQTYALVDNGVSAPACILKVLRALRSPFLSKIHAAFPPTATLCCFFLKVLFSLIGLLDSYYDENVSLSIQRRFFYGFPPSDIQIPIFLVIFHYQFIQKRTLFLE